MHTAVDVQLRVLLMQIQHVTVQPLLLLLLLLHKPRPTVQCCY